MTIASDDHGHDDRADGFARHLFLPAAAPARQTGRLPSGYSRLILLNFRVCSVSAISVGSRSMLEAP